MLKTIFSLSFVLLSYAGYCQTGVDSATSRIVAYDSLDQPPKAEYSLPEFISKTIRYPDKAREDDIEGRVIVRFIINEDGSISDAEIVRSPHLSMSAEVLRITKLMPKWSPGIYQGKPAKCYFYLPVAFKLEGRRRRKHKDE